MHSVLLCLQQSRSPREKFYWGYIWDGTGSRKTQPIRNPRNKSYMPADQVTSNVLLISLQLTKLTGYVYYKHSVNVHYCFVAVCP
jgi:hypothetical protein